MPRARTGLKYQENIAMNQLVSMQSNFDDMCNVITSKLNCQWEAHKQIPEAENS